MKMHDIIDEDDKSQDQKMKLELSEDLTIAPLQCYLSFLVFIVPEKSVTKIFKNGKI